MCVTNVDHLTANGTSEYAPERVPGTLVQFARVNANKIAAFGCGTVADRGVSAEGTERSTQRRMRWLTKLLIRHPIDPPAISVENGISAAVDEAVQASASEIVGGTVTLVSCYPTINFRIRFAEVCLLFLDAFPFCQFPLSWSRTLAYPRSC